MKFAPIVLFTYARPKHTKNILDSLTKNKEAKESILYVYCDGAKDNASLDILENIKEVRQIVKNENRFEKVIVIESEKNKGLANSIIEGVTEVINRHGKVIVLEDDLNLSSYFLHYMNDSLEKYAAKKKVGQIGACNFFANGDNFPTHFFLYTPDCWGWATWSDRWEKFNPSAKDLLEKLEKNSIADKIFNIYDGHYFTDMLKQQIEGKVSSWAIRWQAVCALQGWVTLYPNNSVSQHIESKDATHASINIIPPLVENKIEYREIDAEIHPYALKAQQSGYLGKTDFYGNPIQTQDIKISINSNLKSKLKRLVPTRFIKKYYSLRYNYIPKQEDNTAKTKKSEIWKGNYPTWQEAEKNCQGYDKDNILKTCKNALLKVKNGDAVYERDGFLFDKIQYSWPLLAALQKVALEHDNYLSVLDFGGSLGSSYYQNKDFIGTSNIDWSIIEQSHFVDCGKENFQNEQLRFFHTLEECLQEQKPNILLLSSVLQYLQNPFEWIEKFNHLEIDYIVIDRTAVISEEKNLLTVQTVPKEIYEASYPAWFFNEKKLLASFNKYDLISSFNNGFTDESLINSTYKANWMGYILKKKKHL